MCGLLWISTIEHKFIDSIPIHQRYRRARLNLELQDKLALLLMEFFSEAL